MHIVVGTAGLGLIRETTDPPANRRNLFGFAASNLSE
jgi:hypothetical protein